MEKNILDLTETINTILPHIGKVIEILDDSGKRYYETRNRVNDDMESDKNKILEIFDREIAAEPDKEIKQKLFDKMIQYDREKDESKAKMLELCFDKDRERRMQILCFAGTMVVNVALPLITKNTNIKIPMRIPA